MFEHLFLRLDDVVLIEGLIGRQDSRCILAREILVLTRFFALKVLSFISGRSNSNPTLLLSPSLVFKLMFDILRESSVVSTEFLFIFLNSIFPLSGIVV